MRNKFAIYFISLECVTFAMPILQATLTLIGHGLFQLCILLTLLVLLLISSIVALFKKHRWLGVSGFVVLLATLYVLSVIVTVEGNVK
jgi:hypothetical protein